MAYIVCHAEKQTNLTSMPLHIDRIGVYEKDGSVSTYPDDYEVEELRGKSKHPQIIHPEWHKWNRGGGATYNDFSRSWREEIVKLERSPQSNASLTVCFNNSAGEEFWVELRKKYPKDEDYFAKCEEFFADCREVLDKLYPHGKTLKWCTHYEEKEPHMHVLKPPILLAKKRLSKKAKAEGRSAGAEILKFASGEFLGGRQGLTKLQDEIYEQVGKKWGLERGERGSDAQHTNQVEWHRNLSKKDKELAEELNIINAVRDKNERVSEQLKARETAVKKAEDNIKVLVAKLNKQKTEQDETSQALNDREAAVETRENAVTMAEAENKTREAELEKKKKKLNTQKKRISYKNSFVKNAERAINDMKEKLSGEDQIAVTIITELNQQNIDGTERRSFYEFFSKNISKIIEGIMLQIRNMVPAKTQQNARNGNSHKGLNTS